jgi:hypothetical protein
MPCAPAHALENPSREALAALPEALVRRHAVFPFRLTRGRLAIAPRDPGNRSQRAELAAATKLRIAPYLASELRLLRLLEEHFGIRRQPRCPLRAPGAAPAPQALPILLLDDVVEPGLALAEPAWTGLGQGEELIDADSCERLYQRTHPPRDGRGPREGEWLVAGGASRDSLEQGLAHARDRDAVVSHALALALAHAHAVALVAVRGTAQGLAAAGAVAFRDLRGARVAPQPGRLLAAALDGRTSARGAPRPGGRDARLARLLRPAPPAELAFFRIRIASRVANVLSADEDKEPFANGDCGAPAALCERVSASYARIIVERRRRMC